MPAIRTAVIQGDNGKWLGSAQVPEATMLLSHKGELFIRTPTAVRLSGGGVGIVFSSIEPLVRDKLGTIQTGVNRG